MNGFMRAVRAPNSVSLWNEMYMEFVEAVKTKGIVGIAAPGYCQDWAFRTLGIAEMRVAGVRRLHYSADDLIVELPKPDEGKHLQTLAALVGGERTVAAMFDNYIIKCGPELVAMRCCLQAGAGFHVQIGTRASSSDLQMPCARCKASRKSSRHCRTQKGHTAPPVERMRAAKRPASAL